MGDRGPRRPNHKRRQADDHRLIWPLLVLEDFITEDHVMSARGKCDLHPLLPLLPARWSNTIVVKLILTRHTPSCLPAWKANNRGSPLSTRHRICPFASPSRKVKTGNRPESTQDRTEDLSNAVSWQPYQPPDHRGHGPRPEPRHAARRRLSRRRFQPADDRRRLAVQRHHAVQRPSRPPGAQGAARASAPAAACRRSSALRPPPTAS